MPELNLGFELGDTSGWTLTRPDYCAVVASHTDAQTGGVTTPHEGVYMLRMKTRRSAGNTVSRAFGLYAGQVLSGWVAVDSRGGYPLDYLRVIVRTSAGDETILTVNSEAGWQRFDYPALGDGVVTILLESIGYHFSAYSYFLIDGFTISGDPPPVVTGTVAAPILARVYTVGGVSARLAANVGGGRAVAPLRGRAFAVGAASAPLLAGVRGARYAIRAFSPPAISPDYDLGAVRLPLVANVYDTAAAGFPSPTAECPLGVDIVVGVGARALAPYGVTPAYWQTPCALPLPVTASGTGRAMARLMASVAAATRPLATPWQPSFFWGGSGGGYRSWPEFDRLVGRLALPRIASDAGVGTARDPAGVYPMPFQESLTLGNAYGVVLNWFLNVTIYSLSPPALRWSTRGRGHLRVEAPYFRVEAWPDGTVSILAWSAKAYDTLPLGLSLPSLQDGFMFLSGWTQREVVQSLVLRPTRRTLRHGDISDFVPFYESLPASTVVDTLLEDTQFYGGNRAAVALEARVGQAGQAVAPLLMAPGSARGVRRLSLIVQVSPGTGTARAGLVARVMPAGVAADLYWSVSLRLAGVEVSGRLIGEVVIEAEAGSARLADFALAPSGGALDFAALVRAPVSVDWLPASGAPLRLFTGVLLEPAFDPQSGVLRCTASDDRAVLLDRLDDTAVAALTPGAAYSPAVHGAELHGARLAEARLSTLDADLDLSATGAWRLSPWAAAATPDYVITPADYLDERLSMRLVWGSNLVSRVVCRFEYRYPLLRDRRAAWSWAYADCAGHFLLQGALPFRLSEDSIRAASESEGWRVVDFWGDHPPGSPGLLAAAWTMARRHAQTVTEAYTLTVSAPLIEAAYGALPGGERRASLAVDYDTSAWTEHPEAAPFPVSPAGEPRVAVTDRDPDGRAVADAAIAALLAQARRDILASQRGGRILIQLPIRPEIDLPHTLGVAAARLSARGRVVKVVHTFSGDGSATTDLEIAVSGLAGSNPVEDALAAPAPPVVPAPALDGFGGTLAGAIVAQGSPEPDWEAPGYSVVYRQYWIDADPDTDPNPDTFVTETIRAQFRVDTPAVPDADSQPLTLPIAADYRIAVPSDALVLIT